MCDCMHGSYWGFHFIFYIGSQHKKIKLSQCCIHHDGLAHIQIYRPYYHVNKQECVHGHYTTLSATTTHRLRLTTWKKRPLIGVLKWRQGGGGGTVRPNVQHWLSAQRLADGSNICAHSLVPGTGLWAHMLCCCLICSGLPGMRWVTDGYNVPNVNAVLTFNQSIP